VIVATKIPVYLEDTVFLLVGFVIVILASSFKLHVILFQVEVACKRTTSALNVKKIVLTASAVVLFRK
jgi:hypothetical protein